MLLAKGLVSEDELVDALRIHEETGTPLGDVLVERGSVSVTALADVLLLQHTWRPLGQLLLERQLITEEQLDAALAEQQRTGRPLGEIVRMNFFVPAATLGQILADQYELELEMDRGFGTGLRRGIDARQRGSAGEASEAPAESELLLTSRLRRPATPPSSDNRPRTATLHAALEAREETIAALGSANQRKTEEIAALRSELAELRRALGEPATPASPSTAPSAARTNRSAFALRSPDAPRIGT